MTDMSVVMLGRGSVGKSAITTQFCFKEFKDVYDPTLEDAYQTTLQVDETVVDLEIIDTAGQEEYSSLRDNYLRSGEGFCIVYSITEEESLKDADALYHHVYRVMDSSPDEMYIPMVLCGNKCDLEDMRVISTQTGKSKAEEWGVPFFEVSAKNDINVTDLFDALARNVLEHPIKSVSKYKSQRKASGCFVV
ncbi:small monomeric GTPase [Entamoeba marina]